MMPVHPVWQLAPMATQLSPLKRWHGRLDPLGKHLGHPLSDCPIGRDCDDNGSGLFAVPQSQIIQPRLSARF